MVKVLTKIRYHVKSGFRHGFKNVIFSKFFFGFVASIGVLLSSHDKTGRIKDNLRARLNDQEDTFDFVIVGAGTAGSLLANRLSEQHKVLVLEAGGEPHPLQRIPAMAFFMLNYRETDWMHRTVPQRRACFSSPNRRAGWCQGRNLGGTSNLNWMVHMRGSPRDYDNWAKITNDESWSYEALLHYFRKHENYQGDSPDREAHGFDGDMMFEGPSYTGMAKEFIRAGQELGYEHVDLNARFEEGFDSIYSPMEMGERKAAYHAFLEPVRDRETLTIRKYSRATKILIRSFDNTAFGVEYNRHGVQKSAYATKEVILCAGTVESPKLLMLSGIGPKTHLADLGIPVTADLPVGKNLQDHLAVVLGPFFVDPPRSYLIERDITLKSFYEYKSDGNGPLSSSLFQAAAMISSKNAKHSGVWNWPDILLLLSGMAGHKTFARDMAHAFNLNQKLIKKYYHHAQGRDSFMVFVSAARPEGRGDVTLEKRDADAPPSINPHYLENDNDMQITLEGIKTALYLVENTTSFQNLRARFTNKKFPGCDHMPFRSDAYWECYTRHFSVSLNDGVGSCAMGNPDLNLFAEGNGWGKNLPGGQFVGAVVDPKLQVIGINHLRVADASVMPQIVGSQPMAAVLMIAEKCADIINDAWNGNGDGPPMTTYKPYGWDQGSQTSDQNSPPPQQQYGAPPPPPQQNYGPPPQQNYGPPPPQQNYGAPPPVIPAAQVPQNSYGAPPQQQYGPPGPPQYGAPASQTPDSSYGAPPPGPQYGPPDTSYGPPTEMDMTTMPMEGGYSSPTSSEPPPEMVMANFGESQQMSEVDEETMMTTTPEEETTTMTTTTSTTTMGTTSSDKPPVVSYGPPQDSASETTTLIPSEAYGPPGFLESNQLYNGWSGGGIVDQQYGPPGQQYGAPLPPGNFGGPQSEAPPSSSTGHSFDNTHNNSPAPYLTPPGLPGEDTTTMASSTTTLEISPPPGERAEPPYQPQLGNPLFGGGDPRNIPPPGDSDTSSTTIRSGGNGLDPPEENAPASNNFNPILSDQATSESSAIGGTNYKSFFTSTDSPGVSGSGSTAAARPDVGFLEHDTKLRPGVQISNPFPDIYYATQESNDVPESFFKKYPITSSVEFGNKIPSPPNISGFGGTASSGSSGPMFFRNPEFTTRQPIVFGNLLKKQQKATKRADHPHPYQHFNKSAVAVSRQAQATGNSPPYIPYYNDKNRRPDEGTVKPTVLYKSIGATNKIPSTANVPNIYYNVKDKISKEGPLPDEPPGSPVMLFPSGTSPTMLSPSTTSAPASPVPMLSGFGGSAASSSNNYWTNASPVPMLQKRGEDTMMGKNTIQVEIAGKGTTGDGGDNYWTNASPKPIVPMPMPRQLENSIPVESDWKRPARIRALRRKPTVEPEEDKRRIVRIKSEMIWTTTQRPTVKESYMITPTKDPGSPEVGTKMKIRVKTKEALMRGEVEESEAVVSPYWTQANRTNLKTSTTTPKPDISISGTSSPTQAVYYQGSANNEPVVVTPRPLLSVQLWPNSEKKEMEKESTSGESGGFLSHPGFGQASVETVGIGTINDDQESSDSILSNLLDTFSGRRRRPTGPPRFAPHNSHYDGTVVNSTPIPFRNNYAGGNHPGANGMVTQVPDLFVQDVIRDDEEQGQYENRKKFTAENANPNNPHGFSHHQNYQNEVKRDHNFQNNGAQNFGNLGPGPPHQFDSGERNRFNYFSEDDNGTPNPNAYQHHQHNNPHNNFQRDQSHLPPPLNQNTQRDQSHLPPPLNQNFQQGQSHLPPPLNQNFQRDQSHLPPPINQNFQEVTTPGNIDFSSPAYDENPLKFLNDATPKIPERFNLQQAVRDFDQSLHHQQQHHPPPPPPPQNLNNHLRDSDRFLQSPSSSVGPPPNLPQFIENSGELGSHFNGGTGGGFSDNHDAIANRFPSNQPPSFILPIEPARNRPLPDFRQGGRPNAFSLGHSSPVGMGGGSSLPPAKGFNNGGADVHATHQPPTLPHFELPPRLGGGHSGGPTVGPQLALSHEDLGQIPDIFGFRNVLPSTSSPLEHGNNNQGDPGGRERYHTHHDDNFNVAQLDFSSPPTTALQQSIHNILTGPSSTLGPSLDYDGPTQSIGLHTQSGSLDLPEYLGETRPKTYEDGVDPNKISLTYDDTGSNGFLDPPVIMGDGEVKKTPLLDISQISLTGNNYNQAPPELKHNHHGHRGNGGDQNNGGHPYQFQDNIRPTGGTAPFSQESRKEDVTQTREQILSNFGPQKDPEDLHDGGHHHQQTRPISTRPPPTLTHQGGQHINHPSSQRPFGNQPKGNERERPPFQDFGEGNFFNENPFAQLLHSHEPLRHPHGPKFDNGSPTPQPDVFSVTPFEQPDFTRFDLPGPIGSSVSPNHFGGSAPGHPTPATGTIGSLNHSQKPKMKEYTIYTNPDDVDITVDQSGAATRLAGGTKTDPLRRRADGFSPKRRKRRRGHHKRGAQSTRRGGRAIRLRPLWGGEEGTVPQKRRRRYYKLRRNSTLNEDTGNGTSRSTSVEFSTSTESSVTRKEDDMTALSQELLTSFLGFGFGSGGPDNEAMLRQLLRNASAVSSREEEKTEGEADNLSLSMEESDAAFAASTPASVESSTETSGVPFASEWTSFEAATTNASILG